MLILMRTDVYMAKEDKLLKAGQKYDIPKKDAQPMVQVGLARPVTAEGQAPI